jgi:hypothetical protein
MVSLAIPLRHRASPAKSRDHAAVVPFATIFMRDKAQCF